MAILFGLKLKTSDFLVAAVLLGCIAHLMIFMNGYWNDMLWMSVIITVGVPVAISKYLKTGTKRKQVTFEI